MPVVNNGVMDGVRRIGARVRDLAVDGGLPGVPLGFRLRGATAAGPPATGTWKAGDTITDRAGNVWICTTAGNGTAAQWSTATTGLQFRTGGGPLTAAMITAAQGAGFQGIFLDPRYIWDASGLVIADVSNFVIESRMQGSVGWNGNVSYNTQGYVTTSTNSPADGIQIYSDSAAETQGVVLRGLVLVGSNSNAVIHYGGRQRRCGMEHCLAYNTNATATTVASGSNTVNVSTFTGSQALSVASSASFASSGGNVFVVTSAGTAVISYTGTGSGTLTGCTLLAGSGTLSTNNSVKQAAFAVIDDTAIEPTYNSEDQFFTHCAFAGQNSAAIGIDIGSTNQHANDTLWSDITTSAKSGPYSIVALGGSNHSFFNYYDRSSPSVATVYNHGATLMFTGGEDLNGASGGVAHLMDNSSSVTLLSGRTISTGSNTTTVTISAGNLVSRQRNRWGGTFAVSGTANVDLSDPAGSYSGLTISGSAGTLMLASAYSPGTGPVVSGWTGTTKYPDGVTLVTAGDTSIVVGGTALAPTVATGTLDVIATQHPPAANWSNNSQKITSLANGSASSDAAAFGQVPVLDTTATDIQMDGTQAAGGTGKAADAGHVHPSDTSRAQDSLTVHLAGAETITGAKTFNLPPNLATQSAPGTTTLAAASAPVVLTDTTSGAFTLTLPASPVTGEWFIVVDDTGQWATHNLTIGRNGKNIDGAASNLTLTNQWGKVWLYYDGTAWWSLSNGASNETPVALGSAGAGTHNSVSRADHVHPTTGLVTSVTAGDTSIVVGGTAAAPTVATGTLDVIATDHPPAANWSNNSQKITSLANGSASSDAAAFGQIPNFATASSMGYLAWNYPPWWATGTSTALTSGVVYVLKVPLTGASISITNIVAGVTTAGVTLTNSECFAAVYDNTGTRIGVTGDQSGVWTSVGLKVMALSGGPFATSATFAYVAIVTNGSTNPAFSRAAGGGVGSGFITQGLSGSGMWFATNGTGAGAAPASLTYTSNSASNTPVSIWCALS